MKITKLCPPTNNSFVINDLPIRSMTLFGALANCYVTLFGSDSFPEFLSLFDSEGISSIFPALKIDNKEIYFLPKPYLSKITSNEEKTAYQSKKKTKKIRWLSYDAMKLLGSSIISKNHEYFHNVDFEKDLIIIGNEYLVTRTEIASDYVQILENLTFNKKTERVRVNVARFGDVSNPFDQFEINLCDYNIQLGEGRYIQVKSFLYFLEDIDENNRWSAVKKLFIEEGIGGKRNLGKGWFEKIETIDFDIKHPNKPELFLVLSNLIPNQDELENILNYDTGIDDGYVTYGYASTIKKDAVHYIKEGSILTSDINGKIIKQNFFDKTIYRYGKSFLLPLGGIK